METESESQESGGYGPLKFWAVEHWDRATREPLLSHVTFCAANDATIQAIVELEHFSGFDVRAHPASKKDFDGGELGFIDSISARRIQLGIEIYPPDCMDWALTVLDLAFGSEQTYICRNTPLERIISQARTIAKTAADRAGSPQQVSFRPARQNLIIADTAQSKLIRDNTISRDRRSLALLLGMEIALMMLLAFFGGMLRGWWSVALIVAAGIAGIHLVSVVLNWFAWLHQFHGKWHLPSELEIPGLTNPGERPESRQGPLRVLTDEDVAKFDASRR